MKKKGLKLRKIDNNKSNFFGLSRWLKSVAIGIIPAVLTALPVNAAKQISLGHEDINIVVSVSALENYLENGESNYELASYMLLLEGEQEGQYRE